MRTCKACHENKLESQYYTSKNRKDGLFPECKACIIKRTKAHAERYKLNPAWVAKERKRNRERQKLHRKAVSAACQRKYSKAWLAKNPDKRRAHQTANNALRSGKLKRRTSCEICGQSGINPDKHHPDYSKPLEVLWVCRPCHGKLTRKPI